MSTCRECESWQGDRALPSPSYGYCDIVMGYCDSVMGSCRDSAPSCPQFRRCEPPREEWQDWWTLGSPVAVKMQIPGTDGEGGPDVVERYCCKLCKRILVITDCRPVPERCPVCGCRQIRMPVVEWSPS